MRRFVVPAAVAFVLGSAGCGGVGGGVDGSGGTPTATGGDIGGGTGGAGTGGVMGLGGVPGSGGATSSGGATGFGGRAGPGGAPGSGGRGGGSGGGVGSGGRVGSGGGIGAGGSSHSGGVMGSGGASATGGGGGRSGGSGGAMGSGGRGGATATGGAAGGAAHNPLTQAQIDAFVSAHNQARMGPLNPAPSPALPPVSWDATLADVAYHYLLKCVATTTDGLVDHNANRTTDYAALGGADYVGENIYATTSTTVSASEPSDAVTNWMSEASSYNYATNNITAAGHYTQVVWRTSVRIGCAISDCPNVRYRNTVLCDYAPGGNNTNQKPY